MAIQDILVHMDDSKSCRARLDAAIQIATTHDAHLIGLYAIPYFQIPGYMDAQMPADIIEMQEQRLAAAAVQVENIFQKETKKSGTSAEWRSLKGDAAEALTDQGRYTDLIIVGQNSHEDMIGNTRDEIADYVVLSAGRPVLIIPNNYQGQAIGKRVMLGWDGGQMAARALHDALPILEKSDMVSVMIIDKDSEANKGGNSPGIDVAHHLARHGIKAEADHITNADMGPGDQLLTRAADMGADLLVTGAYGHSRWKELIMGGVTRQLLDTMPVPVLMSH